MRLEFVGANAVLPKEQVKPKNQATIQQAARLLGKVTYPDLWDGVSVIYEMNVSGVAKGAYRIESSAKKGVEQNISKFS